GRSAHSDDRVGGRLHRSSLARSLGRPHGGTEIRIGAPMKTLRQNARYSIRMLRKNPGFTLIAAVTLALGIGANTAIFSVIYAVLLAPMPYPNPEQLVMVWSKVQGGNNVVSAADYLDWKNQNKAFQDVNAWSGANFNFATAAQPEQVNGRAVTPGFLRMAGN